MSTVAPLLAELGEGLARSLQGYQQLQALLERQFAAALRHQATEIGALGEQILAQVEVLEAQNRQDGELLMKLLGRDSRPSVRELLRRLPRRSAEVLGQRWRELQAALGVCKALNLRNSGLINEQQALMRQLLGQEEHVYAER